MGPDAVTSQLEATLEELFANAQKSCDEHPDEEAAEPDFVRLLEFLLQHPICHEAAEKRFLAGLSTRPLCCELIGFCMHTLRLESVRNEALRRIDPNDPRGWGPLSSVVASFEDNWEDADMYEYYRKT